MAGCKEIPHGPHEPCTCDGCWACDMQYNANYDEAHAGEFRPDMFFTAPHGHVQGCDCDIDWEHVYGRHTIDCGYTEDVPEGRCESCEHGFYMHDVNGRCWFTVSDGVPEKDAVCACLIRKVDVDV